MCAYRFGVGQPGNLPLHVAVQSSAAFPGGFPARWLRTKSFAFEAGARSDAAWMALVDGGVYDNMAEQWPVNLKSRKRRPGAEAIKDAHEPDELIIVNASKNLSWSSRWSLLMPWLGEVLTLKCVTDITYDNTTTGRRQVLVRQFDEADRAGQALRGCLVMVEQSPLKVPSAFVGRMEQWPERASRAKAALEKLAAAAGEDWDALAERNADVPTTLRSLGTDRSVDLLYHGYILAMCNSHVVLGYPLMELPTRERFSRLLEASK